MIPTPSDIRRDAADLLAVSLLEYCEELSAVHIFGSVARRQAGESSDVDLILSVDDATHHAWLDACWTLYELEMGEGTPVYFGFNAVTRLVAAATCIPMLKPVLVAMIVSQPVVYPFDVLVLPIDWRTRLDELQHSG